MVMILDYKDSIKRSNTTKGHTKNLYKCEVIIKPSEKNTTTQIIQTLKCKIHSFMV